MPMVEQKKIALVAIALVLIGIIYFAVRAEVTGRAVGRVYEELNLEEEKEEYEDPENKGSPQIFASQKLGSNGLYVRYYNEGNQAGRVCDCFSFGDRINTSGWVYTKACAIVEPQEEITLKLSREDMDQFHQSIFGKSLDEIKLFGADAPGWCLSDQEIDKEWDETTERVSFSKNSESTACWENKGFFVCRECVYGISDEQEKDCRIVGREFASSMP